MNALTELLNEPVTNRINQRDLPEDNITDGNDRSAMAQLGILAAIPAMKRRSFLIGTMGLATAASIGQLLHAEEVIDPDKMTASEYLKRFPESMTLPDGGKVVVEKFDVDNRHSFTPEPAKQCLLVLRYLHPEPGNTDKELQRQIDTSRRELGQVIAHLQGKWGVKHFSLEGYTKEEFVLRKLWGKKGLSSAERGLLDQAIAELRKRDDIKFMSPEEECRGIDYELQMNTPEGMYDLIRKNTIALFPGETEQVHRASINEITAHPNNMSLKIVRADREDMCIEFASKIKAVVIGTIWGNSHHGPHPSGKYGRSPSQVFRWNLTNRGHQFNTAVLSTPISVWKDKTTGTGRCADYSSFKKSSLMISPIE